jgi:alpha-ketoglutarate-dependent taurine dioxygenase
MRTVEIEPLIGSEVFTDADSLLSGEFAEELRQMLIKRGALVFRNIGFDDDQLRAFAQTMGTLRQGTAYEQQNAGMLKIFHIPGNQFWHIDGTYTGVPPFASILAPRTIAPEGGDTEFTSLYAAFDDLSEDDKQFLSTLEVVHTMKAAMNYAKPEPTLEEFKVWEGHRQVHPLVWRHKCGRRTLLIGATASHIVGMQPSDSYELLLRLNAHATQQKYVYRHKWQMGDVAMWDNTGTMHRAKPFDPGSGRQMNRFTLEGVEEVPSVQELAKA